MSTRFGYNGGQSPSVESNRKHGDRNGNTLHYSSDQGDSDLESYSRISKYDRPNRPTLGFSVPVYDNVNMSMDSDSKLWRFHSETDESPTSPISPHSYTADPNRLSVPSRPRSAAQLSRAPIVLTDFSSSTHSQNNGVVTGGRQSTNGNPGWPSANAVATRNGQQRLYSNGDDSDLSITHDAFQRGTGTRRSLRTPKVQKPAFCKLSSDDSSSKSQPFQRGVQNQSSLRNSKISNNSTLPQNSRTRDASNHRPSQDNKQSGSYSRRQDSESKSGRSTPVQQNGYATVTSQDISNNHSRQYHPAPLSTPGTPLNSRKATGIPVFNPAVVRQTSAGTIREGLVAKPTSTRILSPQTSVTSSTRQSGSVPNSPAPIRRTLSSTPGQETHSSVSRTPSTGVSYNTLGSKVNGHGSNQPHKTNHLSLRIQSPDVTSARNPSLRRQNSFNDSLSSYSSDVFLGNGYLTKPTDFSRDFDTASEASDAPSQSSLNGRSSHPEIIQDVSEIITNLMSSSWQSRRDGLINLHSLFRSNVILSPKDLKKMTEIFTKMFHDPQSKVFSMFLETFPEFVFAHGEQLSDWLYTCLSRLFGKIGGDLLGSVQVKVHRALDAVRDSCSCPRQFEALAKIACDQNQTSSSKVREAMVIYLDELVLSMDPKDFYNSEALQLLLPRIIAWSADTKALDIRKSMHSIYIALFNLNPPEFSLVMATQSKHIQDFVTKILHNHMRSASSSGQEDLGSPSVSVAPPGLTSPTATLGTERKDENNYSSLHSSSTLKFPVSPENGFTNQPLSPYGGGEFQRRQFHGTGIDIGKVHRISKDSGVYFSNDEARDEMSPDINQSGNHSIDPKISKQRNEKKYEIFPDKQSTHRSGRSVDDEALVNGESLADLPVEVYVEGENFHLADIVHIFANQTASTLERKTALKQLIKMLPTNSTEITDTNLKSILTVLLVTSGGIDEVSTLADECITLLLKTRTVGKRIQLLKEIMDQGAQVILLPALKWQNSELQDAVGDDISPYLEGLVGSLLKAYESDEKTVRTTSLLSLVELYRLFGEQVWEYITGINDHKVRLLKTYFKRSSSTSTAS